MCYCFFPAAAAAATGDGPTGIPRELDMLAMVEAWIHDVKQLQGYLNMLAGLPDGSHHHHHHHQTAHGGAVAADSGVTPLLATAAASSHAPHLYAQLGLHNSCLESLKSLKSSLSSHLMAAGRLDNDPVSSRMATKTQKKIMLRVVCFGYTSSVQKSFPSLLGLCACYAVYDIDHCTSLGPCSAHVITTARHYQDRE